MTDTVTEVFTRCAGTRKDGAPCGQTAALVVRDGVAFCARHDPEHVAGPGPLKSGRDAVRWQAWIVGEQRAGRLSARDADVMGRQVGRFLAAYDVARLKKEVQTLRREHRRLIAEIRRLGGRA